MRKYLFILTTVFLSCYSAAFSQAKKEFPSDPKAFASEMKKFFSEGGKQESAQEASKKFLEMWEAGAFTGDEQSTIITTSNMMLKQRFKAAPDFERYMNILMAYKNNKLSADKFSGFHDVFQQLLEKAKKDYRDFSNTMLALFGSNAIYESDIKIWKISSQDYTFSFNKEPLVTFTKPTDLQLFTKEDTLGIYQTKGVLSTVNNRWQGNGGFVYWTRVGFSREEASAKLNKYNIDVRNSDFQADSVQLTFPKVFKTPVSGRLYEKATTSFRGEKASYPRFSSYQNIFQIKNVFKNVDYKGGFTLEGNQIQGTGTDSARAMITVTYNNKVVMRAFSKTFVIEPDKIVSSRAATSFYLDKDSIFHTQCIFNFQEKTRKLSISRKEEGLFASPFFDTYHQLEYNPDNISWNIDSSHLTMRSIGNVAKVITFESSYFFTPEKYMQMQGILDYNPIAKVKKYFEGDPSNRTTTTQSLANYFNTQPKYLENLLLLLGREGFIYFDIEAQTVTIKDKLIHYENSTTKGEDFDAIKFESVISAKPNGKVNLLDYTLELEGVARITLSDTQQTYIIPKEQVVKVKKNRDMAFAGRVHSGRFDFFGKDFLFDYNKFQVALSNLDSVKFKFPEYDKDGKEIGMRDIQNTIQNVNGFLYIDQPGNKSGRKSLQQYPIFECNKESYVFYDKKIIYDSIYKRKTFFFRIDPFIIENLDKFTAKGLQFPGTFVSAGILPEIKNSLSIQEDFSLGFITNSPEVGYPLYKGKGKGFGTFMLSNKGLRSDGKVDYLVSTTNARNFIFFPDSMNASATGFVIPEIATSKYPPVAGKDIYNHWMPYKDSMYVFKRKEPIAVYNGKVNFEGNFILTPVELVGNGVTKYQDMELTSQSFAFFAKNVKTKSGDMKIKSGSSKKEALFAQDINADIDLTKDFGTFKTNKDTSKVQIPSNQFATTLNNFTYDINKKEVNFSKTAKQSVDDAYFVSNNPTQENLSFTSSKAVYNINDLNLKVQDIPFLLIADSKITTPNKELTIEKDGVIGSIKGAEIVTSDKNQYHKIYDALVNVFSKSKFTGYGNYDYLDKNNKKFKIYLSDIRTTETKETIAKGTIADSSKFFLSPKMQYQGNVTLYSTEKNLWFNGFVRPEHEIADLRTQWAKMSDTIEPKSVIFNLPNPVGQDGKELFTGTFVAIDSPHVYNLFYGKKKRPSDLAVFTTNGTFMYDDKKNEFLVGETQKLLPPETEDPTLIGGNYFKLTPATKIVYTEGAYNFGTNFKQIEVATAGSYTYNYNDNKNLFNISMLVDFPFSEDATKLMVDSILSNSYDLPDIKNQGDATYNAFAVMMKDRKDRNKVINEISSYGYIASADVINKSFVLTNIKMTFADSLRAFVSQGNFGLATIKKTAINKMVGGVIKIKSLRGDDQLALLIEASPGGYQYFGFVNNVLNYLASDFTFIDKVAETAAKVEKGKGNYKLRQATVEEVWKVKTGTSEEVKEEGKE